MKTEPMEKNLQTAIALRKAGEYEKSRELLEDLINHAELKARALLNIAWSWDNQGAEDKAEIYYQAALEAGLEGEDKFEALFGLACTYRCLGKYTSAKARFTEIRAAWPEATEIIPFYALCLHNLGESDKAMSVMLELVARHPPTENIRRYQKALHYYARNLTGA